MFCYRSDDAAAAETSNRIENHCRTALAIRADVAIERRRSKKVAQVADAFGRIEICVLNAGINRCSLFLRMPESNWDEIIRVNVGGLLT